MKRILMTIGFLSFSLIASSAYAQDRESMDFLNRILAQNEMQSEKSVQRLSAGTLLWTDDPSSRAIYEKLKTHIDFLSMNIRNQRDLISYYQTRDGYLEDMVRPLQRIRELILMKSNGIYTQDDKELVDAEIGAHYASILKTMAWAQFNTKPLFISWLDDDRLQARFKEPDFYTLDGLDRILHAVMAERSRGGALLNTLAFDVESQAVSEENAYTSLSSGDTNFAQEVSDLKRNEIIFFSNLFLLKRQMR
jgi:flagellin-like hook-associated protein FlgL